MKKQFLFPIAIIFLTFSFLFISGCTKSDKKNSSRVEVLTENWKIQPADKLVKVDEQSISKNGFDTKSWYKAVVPGTVLGSLATYKVIEDPTFGINMKNVDTLQFQQPWWYRTTFSLNGADLKKNVSLRFNGVNYRLGKIIYSNI